MLVIGERVDGRNLGILGEDLDIRLPERPDDRAVEQAPHHAGSVFNGLAPPELDVGRRKKQDAASQFAYANFEGNPRPGGGLAENEPPALARQRQPIVVSASPLHGVGQLEDLVNLLAL